MNAGTHRDTDEARDQMSESAIVSILQDLLPDKTGEDHRLVLEALKALGEDVRDVRSMASASSLTGASTTWLSVSIQTE